ncbi:serine hydrolase domain-containing protein [Nostocoides sp.]|uniref:serine hydrolase domain-containing protein n=1 Tax=Nostocoides sp. TaxID=1917966 RepID=UPI002C073CCF|nr:serine hydrolase [Tetrasphaera sp.]
MSKAGRVIRRGVGGLLALVVVGGTAGYWYERPLLLTGTGYAAHNACAVRAVAGRADPATDLPDNPLVPYLREGVDGAETTGSILGVLARQKVWYTEGFGCTLAEEAPRLGKATLVGVKSNPFSGVPMPTPRKSVATAIAAAFGDDLPPAQQQALGTRAVVVVHNGKIVGERYADGFTAATPQLGWSMSKSVTNLLLGRLVEQGQIAITDDNLRSDWTGEKAKITIDQLMRMTSGLQWDETYALGTPVTRMLYREPDMGAYAAGLAARHTPGSYQQYSSGSTNIVCSILHERTGIGADLPRQQLFAKLGLSSAVWEPDASGTPVCSSYLWATPRDWAAVGQFALLDGQWGGQQLLPEGWMRASTTAVPVTQTEEPGYASGWWSNRTAEGQRINPKLPVTAYWAQGHDGQRLYVVPSSGLVVVRLGFSPTITGEDLRTTTLVHDLIAALPSS